MKEIFFKRKRSRIFEKNPIKWCGLINGEYFQGGNMALAAIGSSFLSPLSNNLSHHQIQNRDSRWELPQKNCFVDTRLISEYYSSTSLTVEYTSKDGDIVSLSLQGVEYGKSILEVAGNMDKEGMQKIIDYIKNSYDMMQKELLKGFLKSVGADLQEEEQIYKTEDSELFSLPEYWNAENTSQRIVDFAISFFGIFEGSGDEFLSIIKSAIEEGFKQARTLLGDLPDQVSNLIDSEYSLTMKKIDDWAQKQGINVPLTVG